MTCGFTLLIKARKPWCGPDITGAHLSSECYHFFLPFEYLLESQIILKLLIVFPVSKKCSKMEFFFGDIGENMKTWSLMHWGIQLQAEDKWHSTHFFQTLEWVISFDRSTTSILFHRLYLRTLVPNYFDSPLPNVHYYFPPPCFSLP